MTLADVMLMIPEISREAAGLAAEEGTVNLKWRCRCLFITG